MSSLASAVMGGAGGDVASISLRLIDQFTGPLKKATGEAKAATGEIESSSTSAGAAAAGAAIPLAAIAAAVGFAVARSEEYRQTEIKLQTQFHLTGAELKTVSADYHDLGQAGSVSLEQIQQAFLKAEPLARNHADAIKLVNAGWKASQVTGEDLGGVVAGLGRAMINARQPIANVGEVMGMVFVGASRAGVSVTDFEGAMARISPTATAAGISLSDQVSILSALAQSTGSATMAGMAFRTIIAKLETDTPAATKSLSLLSQETGINLVKAVSDFRNGSISLTDVLDKFRVATHGNVSEIQSFFGAGRQSAGVVNLMTSQWGQYLTTQQQVGEGQQHLNEGVKTSTESLSGTLGRLRNDMTLFAEDVGTKLQKPIQDLTDYMDHFRQNAPRTASETDHLRFSFDGLGGSVSDLLNGKTGGGGGSGSGLKGFVDLIASFVVAGFIQKIGQLDGQIKAWADDVSAVQATWKNLTAEIEKDLPIIGQGIGIDLGGKFHGLVSVAADVQTGIQHMGGADPGGFQWAGQKAEELGTSVHSAADQMGHAGQEADKLALSVGRGGDAAAAAKDKWKSYGSTLDEALNKELDIVAMEEAKGLPVSQQQIASLKTLSGESITYQGKLAGLRTELGLDAAATDKLKASSQQLGGTTSRTAQQMMDAALGIAKSVYPLQTVNDQMQQAADIARGAAKPVADFFGTFSWGAVKIQSAADALSAFNEAANVSRGPGPQGEGHGAAPGQGSIDVTNLFRPDPRQMAAARILAGTATDADYATLGLQSPAQLAAQIAGRSPGLTDSGSALNQFGGPLPAQGTGPGYPAPPPAGRSAAGGLFGTTSGAEASIITVLHALPAQIAQGMQVTIQDGIKTLAERVGVETAISQEQTTIQQGILGGIQDQTQVIAAQEAVDQAKSDGLIQQINDQSRILHDQYELSRAKTPEQIAVAQQQLEIDKFKMAADQRASDLQIRLATDALDEARLKAADDRKIQAQIEKVAKDHVEVAKWQLKVQQDIAAVDSDQLTVLIDQLHQMGGHDSSLESLVGPHIAQLLSDSQGLGQAQAREAADAAVQAFISGQAAIDEANRAQQTETDRQTGAAQAGSDQARLAVLNEQLGILQDIAGSAASSAGSNEKTAANTQGQGQDLKAIVNDLLARQDALRGIITSLRSVDPRGDLMAGEYERFLGVDMSNEYGSNATLPMG